MRPYSPFAVFLTQVKSNGGWCSDSERVSNQTHKADLTGLLNRNIKEVMAAHPAVGEVLQAAQIGCATCAAGNCLFKDIVEIHALSPEQETTLLRRVAETVYPGQPVDLPGLQRKTLTRTGAHKFAPPLQELVDEHKVIKRVLALIPQFTCALGSPLNTQEQQMLYAIVDFVRNFADRFHHAKEEDLLFKYFDPGAAILVAMHEEHELGRAHIRSALDGIERGDTTCVRKHLTAYRELLTEHIRKEDDILYPWMERQLTDAQIGRLFAQFREVDAKFGDRPAGYRTWVGTLETKYNNTARKET